MKTIDIIEGFLNSESTEASSFSELAALPVGAEFLQTANIATDLVPRAEPHIRDGCTTLDVVGNDGPNLSAVEYPWLEDLKRWVGRGCVVRYLLLNPSKTALKALAQIKSDIEAADTSGKLNVFVRNKKISGEWEDIIAEWETFHFAIFDHLKQLWVETNHRREETFATGCYYLPPQLAEGAGIYEVLRARFNRVVEQFSCAV